MAIQESSLTKEVRIARRDLVANNYSARLAAPIREKARMDSGPLARHSLKTRITVATLTIFVAGLWLLAFFSSVTLRKHMEQMLGEQQSSVVSAIASDINQHLKDRTAALEAAAQFVAQILEQKPAAIQATIEQRPILLSLFNAGIYIVDARGIAIASLPTSAGRIGLNYMEQAHVAAALKEGNPTIGAPRIGKALKSPVFGIAVPIRDARGKVIGALIGVTNLVVPNFLDRITDRSYGKTGSYLLIAPQQRLVITATNKERVMQALPAPGVSPVLDRFIENCDGYAVDRDALGVEQLVSCKGMPASGWGFGATQPTEEAFAPIWAMQRSMMFTTTILTILAALLTWWVLRRQLSPVLTAAKTLASLAESTASPRPLPITHQDEIGQLILGFNSLLDVLSQRDFALRESEGRMKSFFNNAPVGIFISTCEGKFIYINPAMPKIMGYDSCEEMMDIVNRSSIPDVLYLDPARRQTLITQLDEDAPKWHFYEDRYRRKDGSIIDADIAISERYDASSGEICYYGIVTDITERKQAEEELIAAKTVAETASLAKSRFLAAASHDLRQPMQAISFFNEALAKTSLSGEQNRLSDYLSQSIQSMGDLLNALLDISKFDAGAVKASPEIIQAAGLANKINAEYSPMAAGKFLRFKLHFPFRDMAILTDGKLLMSLLGNLIANAIKYTEKGGILVAIRRRGDQALFQVWDTGIGIAAEHLDDIYEEYFQVGNPERDRTKGLGLGLAIVKRIALLLDTKVVCRSRPGRGSVFEFRLSLASCEEREPPSRIVAPNAVKEAKPAGDRIVVVEDDLMVATAMKLTLESCGMTVTRYKTAEDALANSAIADADFYISDLRLPGLSGVEFLDAVQQRAMKPIHAVIVTGDTAIDRIEIMRSTSWQVLFKPIDLSSLLSAIESRDSAH